MLEFIDTHSHIDFDEFNEDFDGMLCQCKNVGVNKIIIPGVTQQDTPRIINFVSKYNELYCTVGIHPSEAKSWNETSYEYFKAVAKNPKVVGIGEIGLDYYWDKTFNDIQKDIFKKQIELAKEVKKPIVVHDREAHQDTLTILKELKACETGVVLHCFSGSVEFLRECLDEGFYISLGGVTTFKNAIKPKEVAQIVPLERLMLETDAPYLTPVPYRGKTNSPFYIPIIAQQIASLKNISVEQVAQITTANAIKFFNLN